MLPTTILLAISAYLATASPVGIRSSGVLTDTFDGTTGGVVPVLSEPIGELNGLLYSRWVYGASAPLTGVKPQSPPNWASIGLLKHFTSDPDSLNIHANITIAGRTKSFDLLDVYYGCRLCSPTPIIGTSQTCVFSATGINIMGESVSEDTFTYVPVGPDLVGSILQAPMNYKQFSKFRNMISVDIRLAQSSSNLATIMMLDNVRHINHE